MAPSHFYTQPPYHFQAMLNAARWKAEPTAPCFAIHSGHRQISLGWIENSLILLSLLSGERERGKRERRESEADSGSPCVDKERNDDENNNGRRAIVNQPCCWQPSQNAHKLALCKLNTQLAPHSASLIHLHEHQQVVVLSASNKIRCDAQHVEAFPVSLAMREQLLPLSLLNCVIGAGGLHLSEWFGPDGIQNGPCSGR